jgi:hypothetical protein
MIFDHLILPSPRLKIISVIYAGREGLTSNLIDGFTENLNPNMRRNPPCWPAANVKVEIFLKNFFKQ